MSYMSYMSSNHPTPHAAGNPINCPANPIFPLLPTAVVPSSSVSVSTISSSSLPLPRVDRSSPLLFVLTLLLASLL